MKEITVYFDRVGSSSLGQEFRLESSDKLYSKIVLPYVGNQVLIFDGDNRLAKIKGNCIELFGSILPIQKLNRFKWGWKLEHGNLLKPIDDEYWLNSKFVAKISRDGGWFNWLIKVIKNKSFSKYRNSITITYDDAELEQLFALILLAVEISYSMHSP